jgi:thiamine biosynthesis lipoprotein
MPPVRLFLRPLGICLAAVTAVAGCSPDRSPLRIAGQAMGTTYHVTITRLPDSIDRAAIEAAIEAVLQDVDRHLSGWNAQSELVQFNAAPAAEWIPCSAALLDAVEQAQAVSEASGGAFDVTVGPLVRAWGFGAGGGRSVTPPDAVEIARLQARVGFAKLQLRGAPPALRKAVADLEIDLDGMAPGWAVDRIGEGFDRLGIDDYLIELGGEVRARGQSPERRPWRVAVEAPLDGERRVQAVIELAGAGVSTSGDYRDFREFAGRRISHTIDPRSGEPVAHGLASVTVVHPSVAAADAWATALMVLGPVEGLALARSLELAALFIERGTESGQFTESETLQFARLRRSPGPGL